MTVNDALRDAAHRLQPKKITCAADKSLGRLEAEILLAHAIKKDRVWLIANSQQLVVRSQWSKFQTFVRRRMKHEPIAYILGYKEFYGRRFVVTKDVLIPRPETELMVSLPLTKGEPEGVVFWDVGTGSGAVAVTLAKEFPKTKVLATDISAKALAVAKKNARLLGAKNVTFLKSDLLQPTAYRWLKRYADRTGGFKTRPYLTICANLPYLPNSDVKKLDADVVKFEPKRALFSGADGNALITKFLGQLSRHLPEWNYASSTILIEFDPPQAATLKKIAKKLFPKANIAIHKDLAGRNRVLRINVGA